MANRVNASQQLDDTDLRILRLVQRDGKLPQAEIAKRVGLSAAAVNERLQRLVKSGAIRRFAAIVEPRAVGAAMAAFVEVFLEHPRFELGFIERMLGLDEVQECHYVTGESSLLLKVRVQDVESLQGLLLRRLNGIEGVRQTRTLIVLSTLKEECLVPIEVKEDVS
jgi:Lrp/AsnC family leucine-responsive transcriptional regulator